MIKKIITISFLSIFILGFATPITYGVSYDKDMPGWQDEQENENNTNQDADQMSGGITITANQVPSIINKIARWLYSIVLALSTIFGLYAAFLYLTGDPKNVEKAKKQLIYAVIGVVVAIFAFSIDAIIRGIIR
jgi:hypothetical protein